MGRSQDIDRVLRGWSFQPGVISARVVRASDQREVLQMRIELGLLQMETTHRPDGEHPHGEETYLDHLLHEAAHAGDRFAISEDQCLEVDREFLQYYHRRVCWLALREFDRAVADADHTLELMDFAAAHSSDEEWISSHEQYRPFVLFHRTQAAALAQLEKSGPESAIDEIDRGMRQMNEAKAPGAEEEPSPRGNELVEQLVQLKEWLREHYQLGQTLTEQLAAAVASEKYELAARLRDEIERRKLGQG